MLKNLISLVILSFCIINVQAQDKDETPVVPPSMDKAPSISKFNYSLTAGTSFLSSKSFGNGMSSFVAPEITYKLSPKMHLNAGIMFINSNYSYNKYLRFSSEQSEVIRTRPATSTLAYISGDYLVTDRLTISGMLMKDLSNPSGLSRNKYNQSIQAMSLHMDYKLTENITIGAGMHMSQGNNWGYPGAGYGFYPSNQNYSLFNY